MVTLLYLYRLPEYVLLFCGILEKEKTFKKNWCYINLEWLCIPYIFQWTLLFLAPLSTVFTFNNTKKTTIFECALTGIMYDIYSTLPNNTRRSACAVPVFVRPCTLCTESGFVVESSRRWRRLEPPQTSSLPTEQRVKGHLGRLGSTN